MFDEEEPFGGETGAGGGIFPFLSVLICTIGVMAFILVTGSVKSSLEGAPNENRLKKRSGQIGSLHTQKYKTLVELRTRRQEVESAFETTKKKTGQKTSVMADVDLEQGRLSAKNVAITDKEEDIEEAKAAADEEVLRGEKYRTLGKRIARAEERDKARSANRATTTASEGEVKKASDLQATVRVLTDDHKALVEASKSPTIKFILDGDGENTKPMVLDVSDGAVKVIRSSIDDYEVDDLNPAAEGPGLDNWLDEFAQKLSKERPRKFALLLVRPGAEPTFLRARKYLMRWQAAFVYEPVEDKWKFDGTDKKTVE